MSNLFIALGGTGYKTVSELQKTYANYAKANNTSDQNFYLYLDTDETSIDPVEGKLNTSVIDLSKFKVVDYYKGDNKARFNIWFDGENITIPQVDLKAGAKGIRQLTRMGFYMHPEAKGVIQNMLDKFLANNKVAITESENNLNALKIYIVSGTAGGTGSGILYDFLYTMWRYYLSKGQNGNLDVTGLLLMPNLFLKVNDSDLVTKYELNGFAFIQETNALVKMGLNTHLNDQFCNFFNGEQKGIPEHTWQPFQKAIIVDDLNKNFEFTQKYLYETISEFLFSFTLSKDEYGHLTKMDTEKNVACTIQELLDTALTNAEPDKNLEYVNTFSSFGILVMKSANEYFSRYANNRLKKDVLTSIIGNPGDEKDGLYEEITNNIQKKFNELIDKTPVLIPKCSTKEEKQELLSVIKALDFNKKLPVAKEQKIKEFISQMESIKDGLNLLCENLKKDLFTLHETKLADPISLNALINAITKTDNYFYDIWALNDKMLIDEKSFDVVAVVKSKMTLYISYMLSKGNESGKDKGIIDQIISHLCELRKEFQLHSNSMEREQGSIIKELEERKKNQASAIVPDIDEIIGTEGLRLVFKPEGPFVNWYNSIGFDIKKIHGDLINQLYDKNKAETKFNFFIGDFKIFKFSESAKKVLEANIVVNLENTQNFITIINKTVYDLLDEGIDGAEDSIRYFKKFDYPFIQLRNPIKASRFVVAGYFTGQDNLKELLGYQDDINHIPIDNEFFKDRIIKIAFHNKIALNDYFLFDHLKTNFENNFTKLKKAKKIVATPFLHKDFACEDFSGNVYRLLENGGQKAQKDTFKDLSEPIKQLIYKYGLLYLHDYTKKAVESGIFKHGFDPEFILFKEAEKEVLLYNINFSSFTKKYNIDKTTTSDFNIDCEGKQINFQGNKKIIASAISYFSAHNKNLSEINILDVAGSAWAKLGMEGNNAIINEGFAIDFQKILTIFFDFENTSVKRNFLEYFEAIFS